LHRTLDKVNEASSKLNLDSDKMSSALFWFYKGNPITDEIAFDAIKEADLDQVISIWTKLTSNGEVSQRNASAYSNLGTLYLSGILEGTNTYEALLEQGISLKLKFLESDFIKDFKAFATDETYKTTKKELQLLFLNQVQSEIEKSGGITSNKLLDILTKQEFSAKEDFLKGFVQKPIEQIEQKIETAKKKRTVNKLDGAMAGRFLFENTESDLKQVESIVGASDFKYVNIADKLAEEILICSIDFFNESQTQELTDDYPEIAVNLTKYAEAIAKGSILKARISKNKATMEDAKDREINSAIDLLKSIKDAHRTYASENLFGLDFNGKQTVTLSAYNNVRKKRVNWDKAVKLIREVIPRKKIKKMISGKSIEKIEQYKSLVTFILSNLNYSQKMKVRYLVYWEKYGVVKMLIKEIKWKEQLWLKWLAGIALFLLIVFLIWGEEGLGNVFAIAIIIAILTGIDWLRRI
jgi:hypothetical protein